VKLLVRSAKGWTPVDAHVYEGEQDLQKLLLSAPGVLSATQFGGPEFVLAVREFGLPGSGATDLVGLAADGSILIAECKLAKNEEIKRKVIGQILEYAAYMWQMPVEEFRSRFEARLGTSVLTAMQDRIQSQHPQISDWVEASFMENVSAKLETGNFTLVIVVDALNDELSRTIKFINEKGRRNGFLLYALQLLKFASGGTEVLLPQLHGASVEAVAEKKSVVPAGARTLAYQTFFAGLLDTFHKRAPGVTGASKAPASSWMPFTASLFLSYYAWSFTQDGRFRTELYLDAEDPQVVKKAFDALYGKRNQIEDAMGEALSWERLDETGKRASRVATYHDGNAYDQPESVPILTDWGAETMARLVTAVKPILAELRAELAGSKGS
jgi:hypothetical protein